MFNEPNPTPDAVEATLAAADRRIYEANPEDWATTEAAVTYLFPDWVILDRWTSDREGVARTGNPTPYSTADTHDLFALAHREVGVMAFAVPYFTRTRRMTAARTSSSRIVDGEWVSMHWGRCDHGERMDRLETALSRTTLIADDVLALVLGCLERSAKATALPAEHWRQRASRLHTLARAQASEEDRLGVDVLIALARPCGTPTGESHGGA